MIVQDASYKKPDEKIVYRKVDDERRQHDRTTPRLVNIKIQWSEQPCIKKFGMQLACDRACIPDRLGYGEYNALR